jgi:hypothetical protein
MFSPPFDCAQVSASQGHSGFNRSRPNSPAIVVIDLAGAAAHRIGPMVETSLADAAENSVEIRLADQEGIVFWSDRMPLPDA